MVQRKTPPAERKPLKEWMRYFFESNQRMPTYRDIQDAYGYSNVSLAALMVERLVLDGFLEKVEHHRGCGYSPLRFKQHKVKLEPYSC